MVLILIGAIWDAACMLTGFNQPFLIASCAGAVYGSYSDANVMSGDRMWCFLHSKLDSLGSLVLLSIFD